jgi:hypothetical protein
MMLAYSIISFLVGLVVYATAPLYKLDHDRQTALGGPSKLCTSIHPSASLWETIHGHARHNPVSSLTKFVCSKSGLHRVPARHGRRGWSGRVVLLFGV